MDDGRRGREGTPLGQMGSIRRAASAADVQFLESRPERDGDSEDTRGQENSGALEGEVPPRVGDDTADSQHGAPAQGRKKSQC